MQARVGGGGALFDSLTIVLVVLLGNSDVYLAITYLLPDPGYLLKNDDCGSICTRRSLSEPPPLRMASAVSVSAQYPKKVI